MKQRCYHCGAEHYGGTCKHCGLGADLRDMRPSPLDYARILRQIIFTGSGQKKPSSRKKFLGHSKENPAH